jgi:molecular chaperone DnaK (HSP70)
VYYYDRYKKGRRDESALYPQYYVVVDIGCGTTDVALLTEVEQGRVVLNATRGDMFSGMGDVELLIIRSLPDDILKHIVTRKHARLLEVRVGSD